MHEIQVNQVPAVVCVSDAEKELVERVAIGGIYEHYRNKQHYRVVSIGRHTETEELMIVYQPLYRALVYGDSLWIRPLVMFCEMVEHEGAMVNRFQLIV